MTPNRAPTELTPNAALSPTVRVVSLRTGGERRRQLEAAARSGRVTPLASSNVLAEETMPQLASQSLWLLIASAAVFALLIGVARRLGHASPLLGTGPLWARIAALVALNIAGYALMIPAHEAVHALVILALGGRPRFGLKLPLAAYCTAPNQLFLRDGYITIALGPLVALSFVAIVVAVLTPNVAAGLLLAAAGNVSGAVGDLTVVGQIRRLPRETLIADTQTGYIAYRVED